jgi:[acyl-carrier-protein] S-malonyltransferase
MAFAFVFPGQGSQSVGMLSALAAAEPIVQATFAEASAVLGYDLWQLAQVGPETEQSPTERTQPLMLAAGVATWRVWRKHGGALPACMAGHSLGEYSALVCAGALEFAAAIDLVRFRGQAMQSAVPQGQGAMAAILGLEDADVESACREASAVGVVEAANFNSPAQVVIAGQKLAVEKAIELVKAKGAKRALILPVSVPSHTSLMQPAAVQLAARLRAVQITKPTVPIYTVDTQIHSDADGIRAALVQQLVGPVRWTDTVRAMLSTGVTAVVECGPGKVLTGLNRRIERNKDIAMLTIEDAAALQEALKLNA